MTNSLYIRDISSLDELRVAIAKFCEISENELQAIDSRIQSRIGSLKSLDAQMLRMIELAENDLRDANRSLAICEQETYDDEDGDTIYANCDTEKQEVIDCRKRLELCEYNYSCFKREIRNLEIAISDYQNPKVKYRTLIQFRKDAATSSLKQLINGAEDYLSVTSPNNQTFGNLGLAEAVAKIDPTLIIAATAGVVEIIVMSAFSFIGFGGNLLNITNRRKKELIESVYCHNDVEHVCSELMIENRETGRSGKIVSINIPFALQNEKVGKSLIQNMEANCRSNDCKEVYGWTNEANVPFYTSLGYQVRNEVKGTGCEVYKSLNSTFSLLQNNAKGAFQNVNDIDFIGANNIGRQEINPLNIISPEEMSSANFWEQHGLSQAKYIELIERYDECRSKMEQGMSLDEIRKDNSWTANAYDIFHGSEPIRLLKQGDYYKIDSNGRHRVAAAQMYYLQTGKLVYIPADILKKSSI